LFCVLFWWVGRGSGGGGEMRWGGVGENEGTDVGSKVRAKRKNEKKEREHQGEQQ
jgi:hypothetical protein